jgi:AcrR family transcriptional regulator
MNVVQEKNEHRSPRDATRRRHQDLHDRLLDTAEQAIATDGLAQLRARTLADQVGCSVGAIYGVFTDLDTLILAVNTRTLAAIAAAMEHAGGGTPAERLVQLAHLYLDYAVANRPRWTALFQHRMPPDQPVTADYVAQLEAAFAPVEGPLASLCPAMAGADRVLLARSLFSAVHGMVGLSLDEKVAAIPLPVLREQIGLVVTALAAGLAKPLPAPP